MGLVNMDEYVHLQDRYQDLMRDYADLLYKHRILVDKYAAIKLPVIKQQQKGESAQDI